MAFCSSEAPLLGLGRRVQAVVVVGHLGVEGGGMLRITEQQLTIGITWHQWNLP